jgi:hypothetical protein
MTALLYAAIAAQVALWVALWLRLPWTLYLQPAPGVIMLLWWMLHRRRVVREYRALKARHREHEREIMAMLDPQ